MVLGEFEFNSILNIDNLLGSLKILSFFSYDRKFRPIASSIRLLEKTGYLPLEVKNSLIIYSRNCAVNFNLGDP